MGKPQRQGAGQRAQSVDGGDNSSAGTLAAAVAKFPGRSATLHTYVVIDWNDLKYLLAFAWTGSTLAAAKVFGVNQSTVSRRLAELEERLGRRLVERHVGGYRLTELGEQRRPDAERVETAVVAFERRLASCEKEATGMLRLTCPTTIAHRLAGTSLIDTFHARHPGLRVEFVMSDQYLDLAKAKPTLPSVPASLRTNTLSAARSAKPAGRSTRAVPMSIGMVGHNEPRTSSVISWSRCRAR